jgi:hypothetical protein
MRHDFTPRRIGEILDDAIALVRSNWRSVLGFSAVLVLPAAAAYSVVASFYIRAFLELFGSEVGSAASGAVPAGPSPAIVGIALALQALGLVYTLARAMFDATLYSNSAQLLERRRVRLKEAIRTGLRAVVPLVVVQLVAGLGAGAAAGIAGVVLALLSLVLIAVSPVATIIGIGLAYVAAGIAFLAVTVLMAVAAPIVVVEGGIGQAISRSVRLIRRHFWRVLAILAAVTLLATQFESALAVPTIIRELVTGLQQPTALLGQIAWGWKVFDGVAQGIAIAVVLPFTSSVTLLTYLDLRARDEGMDLLMRARELLPA